MKEGKAPALGDWWKECRAWGPSSPTGGGGEGVFVSELAAAHPNPNFPECLGSRA